MTDEQMPNEIPAWIKPWINLLHTIGLPWAIIVLSAYYGIPFANDSLITLKAVSTKMDDVVSKVEKVSSKVDSAVSNLDLIHRSNVRADAQRHEDIIDLKDKDAKF